MGTKFKVPSFVRCTLSCINIIAVLTVVPVIISSALPYPAQPARVVFPIRTYNNDNKIANANTNANTTPQVDISALISNAFNFTVKNESSTESVPLARRHNDSIATSSQKREVVTLPLEKLFSNITSNNTSGSSSSSTPATTGSVTSSTSSSTSTSTQKYLSTGNQNHIPPSTEQKQLKASMKPQFRRANISSVSGSNSSGTGRSEREKIIHSKSRFNSNSNESTWHSSTEGVRRFPSTLPPSLRRSNNSTLFLSRKPDSVFQKRTNDSTSTPTPGPGSDFGHEKHIRLAGGRGAADPEEVIRQALLNHTLMHGAEEDLDRLVFSQLPEGSKLILRSVKIVKTDENGDTVEEEDDNASTAWDVTIANATDSIYDAEEGAESESSEEDEEEDDEPQTNKNVPENVNKNDLLSAGSHESHATANYKVYGTNLRQKEKSKNYHHGNDHGKHHKKTLTDTDGVKVTNYKGKEHGVTDFANSHGNAQANEGGRYKDSKKKNKGRKVTGFKRVYHKEEFQRTEHFYDDEEAKKISENYSLNDQKEKKDHGLKDDDRKYHGVHKEILDGEKVKNEYGTKNAYNKGQHESHTDSEKHKHANNFGNSKNSRYASPQANNYHQHGHGGNSYHPNHNYKAAYSNAAPVLRPPQPGPAPGLAEAASAASPTSPPAAGSDRTNNIRNLVATPPATSFTVTEYIQPDSTEDSIVLSHSDPDPSQLDSSLFNGDAHDHDHEQEHEHEHEHTEHPDPTTPPAPVGKPEKMKVFFSPRERPIQLENEIPIEHTPYAPNFGPHPQKVHLHPPHEIPFRHSHNHYRRPPHPPHHPRQRPPIDDYGQQPPPLLFMDTPFFNKIGKGNETHSPPEGNIVDNTLLFDASNKDYDSRYAKNYITTTLRNSDISIDPVPAVYSTIVKVLPTNDQFYNYSDFHNAATNIVPPDSNVISIDKANVNEIIITTPAPHHGNHGHHWTSYGHENGQESKQHPNHNYGGDQPRFRGRKRMPVAHLARLHHSRRHRPVHSHRPPGHGSSSQPSFNGNNNNPQSHGQGPAGQPSNAVVYKSRRAPFPNFMNGLMDSVANFFTKMG